MCLFVLQTNVSRYSSDWLIVRRAYSSDWLICQIEIVLRVIPVLWVQVAEFSFLQDTDPVRRQTVNGIPILLRGQSF